jgi:GTPase KRas protein
MTSLHYNDEDNNKKLTIAILGGGTVGKTSVTYKCLNKELIPDDIDTTLEDHYKFYPIIFEEKIEVEIIDTAGQEDYQNFFDTWIQSSEGFLLVFSLTDKNSFNVVKNKYNKIINIKGKNIPIILIGNKKDLENEREVKFEEAKKYANEKNIEYIETSAMTGEKCNEAFLEIVKKVYLNKFNVQNFKNEITIKKSCCNCSII